MVSEIIWCFSIFVNEHIEDIKEQSLIGIESCKYSLIY